MPNIVTKLIVNRVDFVDEGANSAAFIELCKRKENNSMTFEELLAKLKPEHAEIVSTELNKHKKTADDTAAQLTTANQRLDTVSKELKVTKEALDTVQTELSNTQATFEAFKAKQPCSCDGEADSDGVCKKCGLAKRTGCAFDETEAFKALPESLRTEVLKLKAQKDAAEQELRKQKDAATHAEAVAKAALLKSLPVESTKLVEIIKKGDSDVIDLLTVVNAALDGTVLKEAGYGGGNSGVDAWAKIEAEADKVLKEQPDISKQKAISIVIKKMPDLYREYLNGGAE